MQKELTLQASNNTSRRYSLSERIHYYWLISRWLSLDVAAGAMVCCLMACKVLRVTPLPWIAIGVLTGTVLLIYTLDHLQDVWDTGGNLFSPRRQFHWNFRKHLLIGSLLLICLLGIIVLLFLPPTIIYFGIVLVLLVMIYLWLVNKLGVDRGQRWFHKELIIACLYTSGIWGVAFSYTHTFRLADLYFALAFLLIALQNLLLFSCFEREEDWLQGQQSMVVNLGLRKVKILLTVIFGLFGLLMILAWTINFTLLEKKVLLTEVFMSGILLMLFAFPGYFAQHRRYRWLGDGVFLLPVWLLV